MGEKKKHYVVTQRHLLMWFTLQTKERLCQTIKSKTEFTGERREKNILQTKKSESCLPILGVN